METVKINNPLYIGQIAPMIEKYFNKINIHKLTHVSYETLYSHISQIVQHGGDIAEFWVCFDDKKPVGFGLWSVLPLPYQGTVYCQHLYKSVKDHNVAVMLVKDFIDFGKRHKAPYYMFHAVNDIVAKVLTKLTNEVGAELMNLGSIEFIARLKENK